MAEVEGATVVGGRAKEVLVAGEVLAATASRTLTLPVNSSQVLESSESQPGLTTEFFVLSWNAFRFSTLRLAISAKLSALQGSTSAPKRVSLEATGPSLTLTASLALSRVLGATGSRTHLGSTLGTAGLATDDFGVAPPSASPSSMARADVTLMGDACELFVASISSRRFFFRRAKSRSESLTFGACTAGEVGSCDSCRGTGAVGDAVASEVAEGTSVTAVVESGGIWGAGREISTTMGSVPGLVDDVVDTGGGSELTVVVDAGGGSSTSIVVSLLTSSLLPSFNGVADREDASDGVRSRIPESSGTSSISVCCSGREDDGEASLAGDARCTCGVVPAICRFHSSSSSVSKKCDGGGTLTSGGTSKGSLGLGLGP